VFTLYYDARIHEHQDSKVKQLICSDLRLMRASFIGTLYELHCTAYVLHRLHDYQMTCQILICCTASLLW